MQRRTFVAQRVQTDPSCVGNAYGTVADFFTGRLLFDGIATGSRGKNVAGSLVVSLLAVLVNLALRALEQRAARAVSG